MMHDPQNIPFQGACAIPSQRLVIIEKLLDVPSLLKFGMYLGFVIWYGIWNFDPAVAKFRLCRVRKNGVISPPAPTVPMDHGHHE